MVCEAVHTMRDSHIRSKIPGDVWRGPVTQTTQLHDSPRLRHFVAGILAALLLVPAASPADSDFRCMADCSARAALYGVCENLCRAVPASSGAPLSGPQFPHPGTPDPRFSGQQAAQQAAMSAQQLRAAGV